VYLNNPKLIYPILSAEILRGSAGLTDWGAILP